MVTTAVASLAAAVLGGLEWRRIAARNPGLRVESALRHARHLFAVVPAALTLLTLQALVVARPDVTWDAPTWVELHHVELLVGGVASCVSFLFGLATYGAFVTRHSQRVAAPVSMLVVLGILVAIERDVTTPIAPELRDEERDGVVLQSSGASCAAASAANLARYHGIVRTERDMAELLGTTRFGTSPAQVVHGLGCLGFSCRKTVRTDGDPTALRLPAMLFLAPEGRSGVGHAVLLTAVEGETVQVLDPLSGRQVFGRAALDSRWRGHAVECERRRDDAG